MENSSYYTRSRNSLDPSQSRSKYQPQCFKCKGCGHFAREYPCFSYYMIGPNGLLVKKGDISQEANGAKYNQASKLNLN